MVEKTMIINCANALNKINNTDIFTEKDISFKHLSGISNMTFKCYINLDNSETLSKYEQLLSNNLISSLNVNKKSKFCGSFSNINTMNESNSSRSDSETSGGTDSFKINCLNGNTNVISTMNNYFSNSNSSSNNNSSSINNSNVQSFNDKTKSNKTIITNLLYKVFGKISEIVDRKLEYKIINGLSEANKGPKIICTDNHNYRIEEFIENSRNIDQQELFDSDIKSQIIESFLLTNSFGDFDSYLPLISQIDSKALMNTLLEDKTANLFNFTKSMRVLAYDSLDNFKKDLIKDKEYYNNDDSNSSNNKEKYQQILDTIETIKAKMDSCFEDTLDLVPKYPILVLSHNDPHPCNILINDNRKVFLIDHEYCGYNYLGFDIADFLLESNFKLDADEYPFFIKFKEFDVYYSDEHYDTYKKYIEDFFEANEDKINKYKGECSFEEIKTEYLKKSTLYKLIALSSIYWFIYAVIYFKYEDFKNKSDFDYFNFSIVRYSVLEFLQKRNYE